MGLFTPVSEPKSLRPCHRLSGVNDRLRAKPPTTDIDRWREGTVRSVDAEGSRVTVRVAPSDDSPVAVTVTEAVFELFCGRLPTKVASAEDVVGQRVWFK